MSKRKNSDENYENFIKKNKKLEREVYSSRRKRVRAMRISSSSSASPEPPPPPPSRHARRSEPRDRQNHNSEAVSAQINGPDDDVAELLCSRKSVSQTRRRHRPSPAAAPRSQSPAQRRPSPSPARRRPPSPAPPRSPLQAAHAATPPATSTTPLTVLTPPTAAASTTFPEPVASTSAAQPAEPLPADLHVEALDDDMEILGMDPTETVKFGPEIHKEVAIRFEHCATSGLTKEVRTDLTERHLIPSNCKLVDAPILNPQTHGALIESVMKRDKAIEMKQKMIASAISSLGEAITMILSLKEKQPDLLRLLINTGRIMCDCQHHDSQTRRNYVLSSIIKEWKEQMKTTKIDNFLFGQNLEDTLKTAKAINKLGADLKLSNPFTKPKVNTKSTPSTSKNWRNFNTNQKQTAAPKTKGMTAPTATKNPRTSSSKPSQQRPRSSRR